MIRRLLAIDPGILKVVPEAAKIFLTSSRRCGLCGGVFRDDLPCRLCLECWDRLPRWEGDVCRVCKKPLMPSGPVREEVRRDRCTAIAADGTFLDGTVISTRIPKEAIRDRNTGGVHPEMLLEHLRGLRSRLGIPGCGDPHSTPSEPSRGERIQPGRVDRSRVCLGDWCETRGRRTREGQRHCGPKAARGRSQSAECEGGVRCESSTGCDRQGCDIGGRRHDYRIHSERGGSCSQELRRQEGFRGSLCIRTRPAVRLQARRQDTP